MVRNIVFLMCATMPSSGVFAQQMEQVAIMEPINALFEGMNKGDSAMVHKAFMEDAGFSSIGTYKEGNPKIGRGNLHRFLVAMGTPREEVYSEPIWDVKIEMDGHFAQVWAKYAFYVGKELHHCGVDAFHLFKGTNGWKIFQVSDTRQQEGCEVPAAIQNKFK